MPVSFVQSSHLIWSVHHLLAVFWDLLLVIFGQVYSVVEGRLFSVVSVGENIVVEVQELPDQGEFTFGDATGFQIGISNLSNMDHAHFFTLFLFYDPFVVKMLDVKSKFIVVVQVMISSFGEVFDVVTVFLGDYTLVLSVDFTDRVSQFVEEFGVTLVNFAIVHSICIEVWLGRVRRRRVAREPCTKRRVVGGASLRIELIVGEDLVVFIIFGKHFQVVNIVFVALDVKTKVHSR